MSLPFKNFENSKKEGDPEKKFGVGETKRGERFSERKMGIEFFKLNLGMEEDKNGDL